MNATDTRDRMTKALQTLLESAQEALENAARQSDADLLNATTDRDVTELEAAAEALADLATTLRR